MSMLCRFQSLSSMYKTFTNGTRLLKFLLVSLLLIGVTLLSMLAPVPSISVKPLKLNKDDIVSIPAQESVYLFNVDDLRNLKRISDQFGC